MNFTQELYRGIIKENAVFVLLLGMCPTLAITSSALNGVGMGVASMAVLMGSNFVIALVKKLIPEKVRIPVFIVIIASFVTIIDLMMAAFTPALHEDLGIFIPLIVVNCLILGRAEAFASRNSAWSSLLDGIVMGAGFTIALSILGTVREILGTGTIFGWKFVAEKSETILIFVLQPGAFLALGLMIAIFNYFVKKRSSRSKQEA